ncbi:MAG TPA: tripartite tricarboxylate transporter substrate binding protein [Aquabacterium sp.]|nr:tripartite tricarboxylate transporter substrate binding protein [Aquabacterium sp.]HQC95514.1 tripartite tricarboxylate transporter substrate binding protein [Aquabacterium sp.]
MTKRSPISLASPTGPSRRQLLLAAAAGTVLGHGPAAAQAAWPNRPVRVVVPFPPGGLTDGYARMYCEYLARKFGQAFTIENKTGAGGTLGAGEVAKAAPDGHTLLITTSTPVWTAKVLYKKLTYVPVKDFDPIALFPSGALLLAVNAANVPAKNLRELIQFAKTHPVAWGTYGAGSWAHMLGDVLNKTEKLNMVIAHYRGEAPSLVDLVGGQIQAVVGSVQGILPHVQSGKLRAIGATGKVRTPRLPDLPTLVEQGFTAPVYGMEGYLPFAAPAGTPRDILAKLAEGIREASAMPQLKALRDQFGIPNLPLADLPQVKKEWDEDSAQWIALATDLGITLD